MVGIAAAVVLGGIYWWATKDSAPPVKTPLNTPNATTAPPVTTQPPTYGEQPTEGDLFNGRSLENPTTTSAVTGAAPTDK